MIIKVCGLREPENIRAVSELGVDMLGFIFWKDSPRYVSMVSSQAGIIPDYSEERLRNMTQGTSHAETQHLPKRVGVFVDDMPQNIVTRVYNYSLDYVQLHGEESPVMIENLRSTLDPDIRPGIGIIKTVSIAAIEDLDRCKSYEGLVDMFLFDTKCSGKGGSGEKFEWSLLEAYQGQTPFLLSGGIGPDDVERIKAFRHPQCVGIDVNSRFETAPAVKDTDALQRFIEQLAVED